MTTQYLSKKNIMAMHYELIERFGGIHGIRDETLLESAIGRYQSGYYADCIEEAAALMESLGGNHPFLDSNKRIAVTAPFIFLEMNGYEVLFDEEDALVFITTLFEAHEFSFARLETWIRGNTKPLNPDDLTDESIDNKKYPALENLMQALKKLPAVIKEMTFLLLQRTSDESLFEIVETSDDLALVVGFYIKWLKITTADFNFYSDRLVQYGDDFLKSWATIAPRTEEEISRTQDLGELKVLSNLFREMTREIKTIRAAMSSRILESTVSLFDGLKQSVNALSVLHQAIKDQILGAIEAYKNSIERHTSSKRYFDEQLAITIDSCNHLVRLIANRVDEQQ